MFLVKGRSFHSRYNPKKEAERQLGLFLSTNPGGSLLFLFNPGENHLAEVAADQGLRSVSLYIKGWGYPYRVRIGRWDREFSDTDSLLNWIDPRLPLILLLSPRFFFHPSYLSIDVEEAHLFRASFSKLLVAKKRELFTSGFFSNAYKRNFLKNFILRTTNSTSSISRFFPPEKVPCIVASGPSLEKYKEMLKRERPKLFLISLPSSVSFLEAINLEPDCIVTTDPGYWAGLSLDFLPTSWNCPIFACPTSCLGTGKRIAGNRTVLFSQNTAIEEVALSLKGLDEMDQVPERGTVAATAMELVLSFTEGFCLFIGFDLDATQQSSHVHPHPFDPFFLQGTNRFIPFETRLYERGVRSQESLEHYKNWFRLHRKSWDGRVFSLDSGSALGWPKTPVLPALSQIPLGEPTPLPSRIEMGKRCSFSDYQAEARSFEEDPLNWILTSKATGSPRVDEFLIQNNFFELKNYLLDPEKGGSWTPSQALLDFSTYFSQESAE
ncbi:MAG: DUF115 domain-containing protein [Spirochaetales bacterium]|nr:DUF115 domain-containing protein [Spirochaetales bacterium]